MIITNGVTRVVFIFKKVVIKVPNFKYSWKHFLNGLLSNIRENDSWKYNSGEYENGKSYLLCPVIWCSWGGWILLMKCADVCKYVEDGGEPIDYNKWILAGFGTDNKPSNYGYLNKIIVSIDYG